MKTYIRSASFTGDSLKFPEISSDASDGKTNFYFKEEPLFNPEPQVSKSSLIIDVDDDLSQEMSDAYYKAALKPIV